MAVLARLLSPADFGLVAIAWAVVSLAETLTNLGLETVLIRDKNATRAQFDTAWTIRQIQFLFVASLTAAAAPIAAAYYQKPEVTIVIQIVALSTLIKSFENIGVVNFVKEFEFNKEFYFRSSVRLLTSISTISLALYLRSYWALLLGTIVNSLLAVTLSYCFSTYRPRWTLCAAKEIWGYSQWLLVQSLAMYIHKKADVLILGRYLNNTDIGVYTVGKEVSTLPTGEISGPLIRTVMPGFAQLLDQPKRLRNAYGQVLSALACVIMPLACGVAFFSTETIRIILGENWLESAPLVPLFTAYALTLSLIAPSKNLTLVLGQMRLNSRIEWSTALALVVLLLPSFRIGGPAGIAGLLFSLNALRLIAFSAIINKSLGVSPGFQFVRTIRPFIASMVMLLTLHIIQETFGKPDFTSQAAIIIDTFWQTTIAVMVYIATLYLVWYVSAKPAGFEAFLSGVISKKWSSYTVGQRN